MAFLAFVNDSEGVVVHIMKFFVIAEYIPIRIVLAVGIVMVCLWFNFSGKRECVEIVNFEIIVTGIIARFVMYLVAERRLLNVNNYKNFYGRMKPIQNDFHGGKN
jgi:ABC-type sulfate transport system permease subunit